MLTADENARITEVGPTTPAGKWFRRYWLPACLAQEIPEPDGPPVRVRMLGEDFVAFRDTAGRPVLLEAYCAHRGAPLFLGRNEEHGIRCVYHGWKYGADGRCLDMPSEPAERGFKDKIRVGSYPCQEAGGVIWAYLGAPADRPQFMDLEWLRVPASHRFVSKTVEACNWLQGLEGGIDTQHSSFAHNNDLANPHALRTRDPHPRLMVEKTAFGLTYVGIRNLGDERIYVRSYQFVLPCHAVRANTLRWVDGKSERYPTIMGLTWVPRDTEETTVFNWMYSADPHIALPSTYALEQERDYGRHPDQVWTNFRLKANASNDWLIDRQVQRTLTFTGIDGINTQDYAIQEGMGPVVNRTREHLGTSDAAIIAARQQILAAMAAMEAHDRLPGANPEDYRDLRPAESILVRDLDWRRTMQPAFETQY